VHLRTVLAAALLGALTAACQDPAPAEQPTTLAPVTTPTVAAAAPVQPDPRVGAMFLGAGSLHTCTAAVLDSPGGDLILTAAHCLSEGVDTTFVPGFDDQESPQDVWYVDAAYLDPRWVENQDPLADFAIARVSRDGGGPVESRAGAGLMLGRAPQPGTVVTVTGYSMGEGGGPIGCRGPTMVAAGGFPSMACAGLVDGVSGSPWITGSTVAGLIGGLDGGGCDDAVSYSPPFDDAIVALLARAEAGGPGDAAPIAFGDDC
jgi:hypothetical protein